MQQAQVWDKLIEVCKDECWIKQDVFIAQQEFAVLYLFISMVIGDKLTYVQSEHFNSLLLLVNIEYL